MRPDNGPRETGMTSVITHFIAIAAIVVAGLCTTAMNWRFSFLLGTTYWDGYIWAIFSVALDVSKWIMLPYAAAAGTAHKLRAGAAVLIWLVATIYSFTAAIGFAALNRDHLTAQRVARTELNRTLATMRSSPRWQSSAACSDATTPQSKTFCAAYQAAEAKLQSTPTDEGDPQSVLLARLTGFSVDTVQIIMAVFLAIACEVISALGLFVVLGARANLPATAAPAARWTPPPWRQKVGRDMTRQSAAQRDASGLSKKVAPRSQPGALHASAAMRRRTPCIAQSAAGVNTQRSRQPTQ